MTEPRKATDVLLDLESKVDTLIGLVRSQDLVIKILSNKLNEVMSKMTAPAAPKPTAESPVAPPRVPFSPLQTIPQLDPERQVLVDAEVKLPATDSPQGFRRTSRPETFQGDDVYLGQKREQQTIPKYPTQLPKPPPGRGPAAEVDFPEAPQPPPPASVAPKQAKPVGKPVQQLVQNAIPVVQRIVDKSGKSIFLADVEITDLATAQPVFKTRTNGTGKWMASLGVGAYRVSIRKRADGTKDKIEADQDIQVDGSKSPLELQTVIIR